MKNIIAQAMGIQNELVEWRRHLHQIPEIGMQLPQTTAFVIDQLTKMGYEPTVIAGCGVVALAGGKKPGKCFLIRGDMDALPVQEESGEPFASQNGNMHACGHDFHATMLLGAAKLLKAHEDEINGTVKLMFQPGEETLEGAKAMIEAGILQNPKVDAAAMIHVAVGLPIPAGLIGVPGGGVLSAASDWFNVQIKGKGGHGAMPETTVDPLNVMSHIHLALQTINSREISAADSAVVTVGMMQGGEASNVIPDTAMMKGTIRTFNPSVREFVHERIPAIVKAVGDTFRAQAEGEIVIGCPSVVVDNDVANDLRTELAKAFDDGSVPDASVIGSFKMNGSEDFSFVTQEVPSVMMVLGAGSVQEGYKHTMHHPKARFNENVLCRGAAVYAISAMSWLAKNS